MTTDHLFVVTGGPGSGKSSVIAALAEQGVATMPEAGRAIIRDQVAIGGEALPWGDRAAFAEQMLGWELRSHREAAGLAGPVVLDRGVPDVIGYLRLCRFPRTPHAPPRRSATTAWCSLRRTGRKSTGRMPNGSRTKQRLRRPIT